MTSLYAEIYSLLNMSQNNRGHKINIFCYNWPMAELSNLNQRRAAHLSVRSYGGQHKAKLGEFYSFSQRILTISPIIFSNYSGLIEPKIVIPYFLVLLFH